MARVDLPDELAHRPFTVAAARAAGLRHCDLRALGMLRPTHGVRVVDAPSTLAERAGAWAAGLPHDAVFSHVTAALLHGMPLPSALEADPVLDVMRPSAAVPTRRRGCRGHRGSESREVVERWGVRVVGVADTWCDLAELEGHTLAVDDLVVAGDAVLGRLGTDAVGLLGRTLGARVRPRGKVAAQEALGLLRPGVRSPGESRARLVFARAGFPEPEVNAVVRDDAGGWLLEGDLVWRAHRVVGEYQGEVHAGRRRRSRDAHRATLAHEEGWTLIELWAEDLLPSPRRRSTLLRFAHALRLDPRTLDLG